MQKLWSCTVYIEEHCKAAEGETPTRKSAGSFIKEEISP